MPSAATATLPLSSIEHGNNPRLESDKTKNEELAASIRLHGVLQPIRVRPLDGGKYQIVAGHRRYEAAKVAGLTAIPIVVSTADDQTAYVESLVENLQREDLDPIDEAKAYRALLDMTKLTQKDLGARIGRSQSQISNSLALLGLRPEVQKHLQAGTLSVGHAKVLAYMPAEQQEKLARDAVERKLTVRDVESIASRQKAEEAAEKDRAEKAAKAAVEVTAYLGPNIPKDALVVLFSETAAREAVSAGWMNARSVAWKTDTTYPTYECDCAAIWIQQGPELSHRRICVDKAHERSAKAKATAASRSKEKESENALDRARRAAQAAFRIGPSQMSEDAIRLGLYALLMRDELYGGSQDRTRSAFVKRTGGEWPEFPNGGEGAFAVWEAVAGLSTADLVTEYLSLAVAFIIPNVFTQSAYANREHAAVRQWLVDRFGVDEAIVWGGKDSNGWDKVVPDKAGAATVKRVSPLGTAEVASPVVPDEPDVEATPTCDLCGGEWEDGGEGEDWNGETGNHVSCEAQASDRNTRGMPDLVEFDENVRKGEEAFARAERKGNMDDALAELGLNKPLETPAEDLPDVGFSDEPDEVENLEPPLRVDAQPLDGERVCVSGVVEGLDRNAVANAVSQAGGYFDEKVNGLTTLLVIGEKPGASKVAAAKKFGTKTITEAEFRARVGRG